MRSMGKYKEDIEWLFPGVDIDGPMVGRFHFSEWINFPPAYLSAQSIDYMKARRKHVSHLP